MLAYLDPLYCDGRFAATASAFGLKLPFEQVRKQRFEAVAKLAPFTLGQVFDFLGQVFPIKPLDALVLERVGLLQRPRVVVPLVETAAIVGRRRRHNIARHRPYPAFGLLPTVVHPEKSLAQAVSLCED